ncbi:hypothetical protein E4656_13300 [Natronospirillum operosum]|uniref:Uncharacterized protein n=1 Tax=Natronospirillum operosum TaxID=2759953 RepID=A0A4Z0WA56_9GAMM|nr:hypothetical protein [Natronospirillum operosum]TGG92446.1 hypothetical protein E4656_13300 [Natronospirillum operosum]
MADQKPAGYRLTRPRLASLLAGPWAPLQTVVNGHELTAVQTLNRHILHLSLQQPEPALNDRDSIAAADELVLQLLTASLQWGLEPEAWHHAINLLQPAVPYTDALVDGLWVAFEVAESAEHQADLLSLLTRCPALLHPQKSDESRPAVSAFRAHIPSLLATEDDALRELLFQYLNRLPLAAHNHSLLLAGLPHVHRTMDRHTRASYLLHMGRLHYLSPSALEDIDTQVRQLPSVVPRDPMLPDLNPPGYLAEQARLHRGYQPDRHRPDWDLMVRRLDEGSHNLQAVVPEIHVYTPGRPRLRADILERLLTRPGVNGKPGLDLPMINTVDIMTCLAGQGHLPTWACRWVLNELLEIALSAGPVNQRLSWLRLGALTPVRDLLWSVFERPGLISKADPLLLREVLERAWGGEAGLVQALQDRQSQLLHPQSLQAHAEFLQAQPIWSERMGLTIPEAAEPAPAQGGLQHD